MSLFVLDSSVAVKWVLKEAGTQKALVLRNDIQRQIHEVIAPDVFVSEVAHALTKAESQKLIPIGDAQKHLADILKFSPVLHSFLPLVSRAVEISSATRIAITDCLFVSLAEQEGCDLITADQRLINNLPGIIHLDSL